MLLQPFFEIESILRNCSQSMEVRISFILGFLDEFDFSKRPKEDVIENIK